MMAVAVASTDEAAEPRRRHHHHPLLRLGPQEEEVEEEEEHSRLTPKSLRISSLASRSIHSPMKQLRKYD